MAPSRAPSPLAQLLPGVLAGLHTHSRPSLEMIEEVWKRIAGEKAALHSWPRALTGCRLLVEAEDSGWMYTLHLKKTQLLQGLVELLGAGRIRTLNFRIGEKAHA